MLKTYRVYFRHQFRADNAYVQALSKDDAKDRLLARFPSSTVNKIVELSVCRGKSLGMLI